MTRQGGGVIVWAIVIAVFIVIINAINSSGSTKSSYTGGVRHNSSYYSSQSYSSRSSGSTKPSASTQPTSTNKTSSGSSSKKTNSEKSDEFDARDYAHPDDFYYDHRDDFIDFEEAEDYWEDHQ